MQYTTLISVLFATTAIAAPTAAQSKRDVTSVLDQLKGVVENKSKCDFVKCLNDLKPSVKSCASAAASLGNDDMKNAACVASALKLKILPPSSCSACLNGIKLPDIDIPKIDIPDIKLPDKLPNPLVGDLLKDLPGLPDLKKPDVPDVKLPEVKLPEVKLPEVKLPTPSGIPLFKIPSGGMVKEPPVSQPTLPLPNLFG